MTKGKVAVKVQRVDASIAAFRKTVWARYRAHGRHDLPWRATRDPYKILVSEIMLQQTRVDRVRPFYTRFITQFPTAKRLAAAPFSHVLREWQGLGYNRRARQLHMAAKQLAAHSKKTVEEWESLPGVGPYTARAVAAFAYNADVVFIETNIRTAVVEHFFPGKKKVTDTAMEKVLAAALPKGKAREWYSALMDYGSSLKKSGVSHNARAKGYVKQSKFGGSLREARGAILRRLAAGPASPASLVELLGAERRAQMRTALDALWKEKMIRKNEREYALAD